MVSHADSLPRDSLPRNLILQHEAFKALLDGRLLNAPAVGPIKRVLDIGTGCGIWAAEFATDHPTAEVVGMDNYPQPTIAASDNCRFIAQDAEEEWGLGDAKFDIIHIRLVPFHAEKVSTVLRQCYEHLMPGGYVEFQESWPPCRTDEPPGASEHASKVIEWTELRLKATSTIGIDQAIAGWLPAGLSQAGFVDVQAQDHKWPIGPWMDDEKMRGVGNMVLEMLQLSVKPLTDDLLTNLGMEKGEITNLIEQVVRELGVGKIYAPIRIVWARKPA